MSERKTIQRVLGMMDCTNDTLPDMDRDWWVFGAEKLARLIVDAQDRLTDAESCALLVVGAMMMRQAEDEPEARALTAELFDRLKLERAR